jgi:putative AdoMet-dependent methyltransferase
MVESRGVERSKASRFLVRLMLARPASILQEYGPMMRDLEAWQYDEFQQVGRDYGNPPEVEIYDSTHAGFRDVEAESNQVLDLLGLASSDVLIDFGSGTGTFALAAARRCARVHTVDVSPAMIEYAKTKAIRAGISNIIFSHAGFLTYEHLDQPAAAIATTFASITCQTYGRGLLWRECAAS